MGRSSSPARTLLRVIARLAAFTLVWLLALLALWHSLGSTLDHRQLASKVDALSVEYEQEMTRYASLLADIERLTHDRDTQIKLLKDRFGYAQPDESPIIILRED
jgi:hypothetical protein